MISGDAIKSVCDLLLPYSHYIVLWKRRSVGSYSIHSSILGYWDWTLDVILWIVDLAIYIRIHIQILYFVDCRLYLCWLTMYVCMHSGQVGDPASLIDFRQDDLHTAIATFNLQPDKNTHPVHQIPLSANQVCQFLISSRWFLLCRRIPRIPARLWEIVGFSGDLRAQMPARTASAPYKCVKTARTENGEMANPRS